MTKSQSKYVSYMGILMVSYVAGDAATQLGTSQCCFRAISYVELSMSGVDQHDRS